MDRNLIVIDNFLDDPDGVRKVALTLKYNNNQREVPGVRSDIKLRGDLEKEITDKLKIVFACNQIVWETHIADSFFFQSCKEGTKTWCHLDNQDWTAVLYLTPNALVESGTGIFHDVNGEYKMNIGVVNIYNRLVAFRGNVLYHRSMLPGFGTTLETSRLTQTFFFSIK